MKLFRNYFPIIGKTTVFSGFLAIKGVCFDSLVSGLPTNKRHSL